ncbi:hypothetical protein FGE12_17240 [Aggregicoccus sp. 17bor-14]|nr:hypothetical protein [Simulacricoccus sp. 17bor-14]MRI89897.1 hypothetical protein [Aggregicoccus sp. 17bor-14]
MLAALVVFGRLWCVAHSPDTSPAETRRSPPSSGSAASPPGEMPPPPGRSADAGPATATACRTADQALEAALKAPQDAAALAQARSVVQTCPTLSPRACELGPALDAREPLHAGAEPGPLRDVLATLCERCPAEGHPCAGLFLKGLQQLEDSDPAATRWNLEHAGAASRVACEALARDLVVPAASASEKPSDAARRAFGTLVPVCLRHDVIPPALLHAAVLNRRLTPGAAPPKEDLFERALASGAPPALTKIVPDQVKGAEAGAHAFDGKERSGVDLGNGHFGRWEADGALRAQFTKPLQWLGAVRVRASGPGTLRAIVRLSDVGLEDPERKTRFVNPTVCRFQGNGSWEECRLPLPLSNVEAVSVFPERERITLNEVEILGVR